MDDLFANPVIQSGIIPFTTALVSLLVLLRFGWFWAGLAFAIGFYTAVYFTTGFQITPFNSTRKIIFLGAIAVVVGCLLDMLPLAKKYVLTLLASLSIAAVLWILWPILSRREGMELITIGLSASAYVVWMCTSLENYRLTQPSIYASVFSIGIATSICTLLGASTLLGQLSGSIGAATAAFVLLNLLNKNTPVGISFTFPIAILAGLIGITGVIYADLPWFSLIPIALIPPLMSLKFAPSLSGQKKLLIMLACTMTLAAIAIGITWYIAGPPPI